MNTELFKRIFELKEEINKTNSILEKKEILKKYKDLKEILKYTYDTNIIYSVTSKNYKKFSKNEKKRKIKIINNYNDFFKLLTDLSKRTITGDKALLYLYDFIKRNKEYEEVILNVIDKNLKIRLNVSLINKVFPNLIKTFKVALANSYNPKHINKTNDKWFISRKLDGIRCLIHININTKEIVCYSRQGKEILTLNKLKKDILNNIQKFKENCFLDGEVVVMENNKEDFKGIMEKIRRKNYTMENPRYYCFDIIKEKDFYEQKSEIKYEERYNNLKQTIKDTYKYVKVLEQVEYTEEKLNEYAESSKENEWEGLIIRRNTNYEGKRTNSLLKFKEMKDDEYNVIDIEKGMFRHINQETGLEEEIETLSAVIIDYNNTKVGSGFSINERKEYYENPEKIINKVITVKYFEKTEDSLRFPVFKGIHGEKRET